MNPKILEAVAAKIDEAITDANDEQIGVLRRVMLLLGPTAPAWEGCAAGVREVLVVLQEVGIRYEP